MTGLVDSTPARAAGIFPRDTLQHLTATDWRLIEQLSFLLECARRRGRSYVWPSQSWLAERLGVTREWISRRSTFLHSLGVLRKTWRRPEGGQYRTCLYELAAGLRWGIQRVINTLRSSAKRVNNTAHKPTSTYMNRSRWTRWRAPPG